MNPQLINVVGLFAFEFDPAQEHLKEGDVVTLQPEPTNSYDSNAIRVEYPPGKKLGYVPRNRTEPLHAAGVSTLKATVATCTVSRAKQSGNKYVSILAIYVSSI